MVKNPPSNAGDVRDMGLAPESEESPGEGNGNPLQYSCLGNPTDIGAWQATVHGVTKSWTQLKYTCIYIYYIQEYFKKRPNWEDKVSAESHMISAT